MPARDEVPSTLQRSVKKARDTWSAAHDSAVEQYGEGERAHRVAFAALKHGFEKVGDHWEAKARKGPSDKQAERSGATARKGGRTAGGVDANASKRHLYALAQRLDIRGRSTMAKADLVEAIKRANDRVTRKSRNRGS
jgi:cation transport regulator ChaB